MEVQLSSQEENIYWQENSHWDSSATALFYKNVIIHIKTYNGVQPIQLL